MSLNFHQSLVIALTQSIVTRYGAVLSEKDIGEIFGLSETTIRNKFTQGAKDLPSYTQLKGKRVVMAQDLADFMVHNQLKF
ncbi:hypothetical protein LS68_008005 [Helicobacter sp. MIT 05-5293]|uniref:hypothetical protein n=1 Tax=Helicobacter sp. MIT 05-5293 TaxID=1548149 RepID=UPI00051DCCED|nr:hypothetical protein [Helicobacter sp. MIT 05-5293]TLD80151.1 hypothetical protein LS68_008005 [Helicobacter sp. MIT 05-5293]